jgi:hypothetical protein
LGAAGARFFFAGGSVGALADVGRAAGAARFFGSVGAALRSSLATSLSELHAGGGVTLLATGAGSAAGLGLKKLCSVPCTANAMPAAVVLAPSCKHLNSH